MRWKDQVWNAALPQSDYIVPSHVFCVWKGSCSKDLATHMMEHPWGGGSITPNICIPDWSPSMCMAAGQTGGFLEAWLLRGSCDRDDNETDAVVGSLLQWQVG